MTKVTTVRIEDDLNEEIKAVARAEGVSASEIVRAALYRYVAELMADPQIQARARELLEKDREVLERLAAGGSA
jgi:predicted transcriptional regulator